MSQKQTKGRVNSWGLLLDITPPTKKKKKDWTNIVEGGISNKLKVFLKLWINFSPFTLPNSCHGFIHPYLAPLPILAKLNNNWQRTPFPAFKWHQSLFHVSDNNWAHKVASTVSIKEQKQTTSVSPAYQDLRLSSTQGQHQELYNFVKSHIVWPLTRKH